MTSGLYNYGGALSTERVDRAATAFGFQVLCKTYGELECGHCDAQIGTMENVYVRYVQCGHVCHVPCMTMAIHGLCFDMSNRVMCYRRRENRRLEVDHAVRAAEARRVAG